MRAAHNTSRLTLEIDLSWLIAALPSGLIPEDLVRETRYRGETTMRLK